MRRKPTSHFQPALAIGIGQDHSRPLPSNVGTENHQRDCVLSREPRLRGSLSGSDDVEGGGCQRREPCERSELGRGRNLAVVEFVLPWKKVAVFTYGR